MSIRIVIAGDQPLFRAGLRLLLERQGFTVIGDGSGPEVLNTIADSQPDVAILNLITVDMNGLELAREIHWRSAPTEVIVTSELYDDEGISQTPTDYCAGYVSASESQDSLVAAISEVAHGGIYFCEGWRPNKKALSHRQGEVFKFIAEGKPVKEIASFLGLSAKTVEVHRSRIMDKLQIKDTAHLVRYAIRHRLLSV
jgi:DNA-binding NarL/FixJ family response regulator